MTNDRFNYLLLGDRQKPIALFLHGFMGSCEDFKEIASLLEENFCCLLIDLPGHGNTEVDRDACYQMSEVARGIIELLTQLAIEQCFLVGYSMGGRLALYLAIHFPRYFAKVVLESASPGLETQAARDIRNEQDLKLVNKLETTDFSLFLHQWYSKPLFTSFKAHPHYDRAIALRLNNDPQQLAKSLRYMGLGRQPCLWQNLETNRIPLLLIVGELDRKFVAIAQRVAYLSISSRLEIVENTGHNVHFEHPVFFAGLLNNFWQD